MLSPLELISLHRVSSVSFCEFSLVWEFVKVINSGYFYSNPMDLDSRVLD